MFITQEEAGNSALNIRTDNWAVFQGLHTLDRAVDHTGLDYLCPSNLGPRHGD